MRRTSAGVKTAVRREMLGDRIASPGAGPSVVKRTALAALAVVVEHLELFQVAIKQVVFSSEEVHDWQFEEGAAGGRQDAGAAGQSPGQEAGAM